MSLIHDLKELKQACVAMENATREQQKVYFGVIEGVVKLHQKYRLAKNFMMSDELRGVLSSVGVEIVQGTAAYGHDKIPPSMRGRQIDDTWRIKK